MHRHKQNLSCVGESNEFDSFIRPSGGTLQNQDSDSTVAVFACPVFHIFKPLTIITSIDYVIIAPCGTSLGKCEHITCYGPRVQS